MNDPFEGGPQGGIGTLIVVLIVGAILIALAYS